MKWVTLPIADYDNIEFKFFLHLCVDILNPHHPSIFLPYDHLRIHFQHSFTKLGVYILKRYFSDLLQ